VPLGESVDVEAEIKKIEEELNYTRGFLNSVLKKLSNERFVNNAPAAVVENEQQKQADAEARIKVLEEQLKGLK
jgi:valyl-tRNA synthetase